MKRISAIAAAILLGLALGAPATAASPNKPSATVVVNETDLHYGDRVTFSVTTTDTPTWVNTACVTDFGTSYGGTLIYSATSYVADELALYAPNWPSGGATCTTGVYLVTRHASDHWKVIGSTTFTVSP